MGGAQLIGPEGTRNDDLPGSGHQDQNEHRKAVGVVAGEGKLLCEENGSAIQDAPTNLKDSQARDAAPLAQQPFGPRNQQPQPPGQIILWERFLPVRTLKVLLVENDDSTRHVVSALLRNCSYEVTAVANGLQAWRILRDLTNHIDLVLTEVIMPGLNGIGLLTKIMSHITCKSIPVIMMSSHDSMGTVFKCLSKGAVDFLVKPIRKNELKNLWQHVWRRCHSSSGSGSGSESGTQTQKSVKSKSLDDSENSIGRNDDETAGLDLNAGDSSENGSGTQSSWTKRAAEVSSPQPMSSSDQLADPLDSTCALVIHATNDILCKDHVPTSANGEKQDTKDLSGCKNLEKQYEAPITEQDFTRQTVTEVYRLPEKRSKNELCLSTLGTNILNEASAQAANLIGAIASSLDSQVVSRVIQAPSGLSKASLDQGKVNYTISDSASIELSLKRLRSIGDTRTSTQDERNVLRRLDFSAFSRYDKSEASNQPQIGYRQICSPLENSLEAIKTEFTCNIMLNTAPLKQGSNGSSNNNYMASTAKNTFRKPLGMKEKTGSKSTVKCIHRSASCSVKLRTLENEDHLQRSVENLTAAAAAGEGKEILPEAPSQHHHVHHNNPHSYHYVHDIQQPTADQNDLTLISKAEESPQCGSSNVFNGPFGGHAANCCVNGSNPGSNGNNENNSGIQTGGSKRESANAIAEQSSCGSGNGSRSSSGSGTDQSPLTHREAALKKFREKRKERNYGKKVRYQSRKLLAEKRPRVHGQFARKSVHEQTRGDADRHSL